MNLTGGLQIATIVLVLLVPFGINRKHPSLATCIGVGLYAACYIIQNLWQLAYIYLVNPQAYGLALRLYPLSLLMLVAILAATIFWLLVRTKPLVMDLQAKLIWLIFVVAETWAILEFAQCKMVVDPFGAKEYLLSYIWGVEVSQYACQRRFGLVGPFVTPAIASLTFIWINWRASKIKD